MATNGCPRKDYEPGKRGSYQAPERDDAKWNCPIGILDVNVQPQVWVQPGAQNKSQCDQHANSNEVLHWNPLRHGNHTSVLGKKKKMSGFATSMIGLCQEAKVLLTRFGGARV
jgi:hypothetical protein